MEVSIELEGIQNKLAEINTSQSKLGKNFTFKTHSFQTLSVKGKGYSWALDAEKEADLVKKAFEGGEKSLSATTIIGKCWSNEGYDIAFLQTTELAILMLNCQLNKSESGFIRMVMW